MLNHTTRSQYPEAKQTRSKPERENQNQTRNRKSEANQRAKNHENQPPNMTNGRPTPKHHHGKKEDRESVQAQQTAARNSPETAFTRRRVWSPADCKVARGSRRAGETEICRWVSADRDPLSTMDWRVWRDWIPNREQTLSPSLSCTVPPEKNEELRRKKLPNSL